MLQACFQIQMGRAYWHGFKTRVLSSCPWFLFCKFFDIEQITQCAGVRAKQQMHFGTGESTGFFSEALTSSIAIEGRLLLFAPLFFM